jgi:CRP-like cAMP-binding protein
MMPIDPYIHGYIAGEEHHQDKDIIIREGSKGYWIYMILEGKVKVKKKTPRGLATIHTLSEGDIIGEMILWPAGEGERIASAVADGPAVLGLLDTDRIIREYESLSPRLKSLLRGLIMKLNETTRKAVSLAAETA